LIDQWQGGQSFEEPVYLEHVSVVVNRVRLQLTAVGLCRLPVITAVPADLALFACFTPTLMETVSAHLKVKLIQQVKQANCKI